LGTGAGAIRQRRLRIYEGWTGTLLDVWIEDFHGTAQVFGLWDPDRAGSRRLVLFLGRSQEDLDRITAAFGPLPVRRWLYREEPFFVPSRDLPPVPPSRTAGGGEGDRDESEHTYEATYDHSRAGRAVGLCRGSQAG
jgi:hypothetical protein